MTHDYWNGMPATAMDPFEAAAIRRLMGFRPPGGRKEGAATRVLERLPGYWGGGLLDLVALPGRAMREGMTTEGAVQWAAPFALGMLGLRRLPRPMSGVAADPGGAVRVRRMTGLPPGDEHVIQPFPELLQRPFDWDYRGAVPADPTGRLTHDIDGRPLVARHVAGRRRAGGPDEGLSWEDMHAVATELTGNPPVVLDTKPIGDNAGYYMTVKPHGDVKPSSDGWARLILLSQKYPDQLDLLLGHEVGHMLADFAGRKRARPGDAGEGVIPHAGLVPELRDIYNVGHNPFRAEGVKVGPETLGYSRKDAPAEMIAEAIRAYMSDPNFIKNMAPKTAKRLREYVNAHPEVARVIQLNSLAALGFLGALRQPATAQAEPEAEPGM